MRLTTSEQLFFWRRRRGVTQRAAAFILGVSLKRYRILERARLDRKRPQLTNAQRAAARDLPTVLTAAETCVLLRRRAGLSCEKAAREIGITRVALQLVELGIRSEGVAEHYVRLLRKRLGKDHAEEKRVDR